MRTEYDRQQRSRVRFALPAAVLSMLCITAPAVAGGRVAQLEEIVRKILREAEVESRTEAKNSLGAAAGHAGALSRGGRLLEREADMSLETLAHRAEVFGRAVPVASTSTEAVLSSRFASLMRHDPAAARAFANLAPAERRLVVEVGEAAQRLARRYPDEAESMIRALGAEGLAATRVFGDEVAPILTREGPECLGVLRKTGSAGWSFLTTEVLPHKKKLAAAGVLAAFYANPDLFVDYAGRATEYAAREFGKAGIVLATAAGTGLTQGLEASAGALLASYGLNNAVGRLILTGSAVLAALVATLTLLGLPMRIFTRPLLGPLRLLKRSLRRAAG